MASMHRNSAGDGDGDGDGDGEGDGDGDGDGDGVTWNLRKGMFDVAAKSILELMFSDSFPRFRRGNAQIWQDFIEGEQENTVLSVLHSTRASIQMDALISAQNVSREHSTPQMQH